MQLKTIPLGLTVLLIFGTVGCTTTGAGYGSVRGADQGGVTFDWKSSDDVSGQLTATFADGRTFSGTYFQITSDMRTDRLAPLWDGWNPAWRGWRHWYAEPVPEFAKFYSGRVLANLRTAEGEHMRCRFRLVHPASGMSGGGQGTCQLADGKTIDATFPAT